MSRARSRRGGADPTVAEHGIEVRGMSKSLRGRLILDHVDLTVPRGTLAVIEGANGAGKTTLVRTLATVVSPDAGTARVNGFDVVRESLDVRRSVGVSFANERSLYWRIDAFQNLELFGKIAGLPKRVIAERSAALVERLGIAHVARSPVARMSAGQRQRLMVARALLAEPAVVLLDEPFRGIDEEGLGSILDLVSERVRQGVTALVVAPLVDAVLPAADATYAIVEGEIRPTGADAGCVAPRGPEPDRGPRPAPGVAPGPDPAGGTRAEPVDAPGGQP